MVRGMELETYTGHSWKLSKVMTVAQDHINDFLSQALGRLPNLILKKLVTETDITSFMTEVGSPIRLKRTQPSTFTDDTYGTDMGHILTSAQDLKFNRLLNNLLIPQILAHYDK